MPAASISTAATGLAAAVLASTNDPASAIAMLLPLAGYLPPVLPGSGAYWARNQAAQDAIASNLRCAACAALARASALYQPISYQDAQSVRLLVCDAIDAEATRAADAGIDATYRALRDLRTAVALDLAVRGANLAALVEVTTLVSMPSLAEAYGLYQDTTREPELVASAGPQHPLWLPLTFQALQR
jgi:prophage DNA circulation protein